MFLFKLKKKTLSEVSSQYNWLMERRIKDRKSLDREVCVVLTPTQTSQCSNK